MGLSSLARNILRVFGMITKKVVPHIAMKPRLVARLGKKYVLPRVAKILSKPIPAKLVATTGKKAAATVAAKKNQMFVIRRTGAMSVKKLARVPKSIGKWAWKNKGALTLAGATIGIPLGIDAALRQSSEAKNDNFNNKYLEIMKQQQQPLEHFSEGQHSIPYFGNIQQPHQAQALLPFDMMNSYEKPDFSRYGSPLLYDDDNMALEEDEEEVSKDNLTSNLPYDIITTMRTMYNPLYDGGNLYDGDDENEIDIKKERKRKTTLKKKKRKSQQRHKH